MIDNDGVLHVSNNSLSCTAKCSMLAAVNGLKYTSLEDAAALRVGTAAHKVLALWAEGASLKACMLLYKDEYADWAEENVEPFIKYGDKELPNRLTYENTALVLRYWLEQHPLNEMPFTVIEGCIEVEGEHPLDRAGNIMFKFILDLVVRRHDDDGIYVLDHKSTGRIMPVWLDEFRMSSQMTGYTWGTRAQVGDDCMGAIINAIEMSYLPSSTRKCSAHGIPFEECQPLHVKSELFITQRSELQIKEWKRVALRLANRYGDIIEEHQTPDNLNTLPQEGLFNGSCSFCKVKDFCRAGRPMKMLDRMLKRDVEAAQMQESAA